MESYSVQAVLSAVDKNFTSTMNSANNAAGNISGSLSRVEKNSNQLGKSLDETGGKSQKIGSSAGDILKGVGAFAIMNKAVSLVSDSLGSAIGRFDTLKNYPKVMNQMGYSTDDVAKSTVLLKKGVDGLPTSLQDLTKSAQSFAILEKSATGGAKTATALNDAFIASGASSADASRGVQQYSQMLSSGKVDLMSWRTLQETMPYALTEVAKSFGLTGKSAERDLYAKLQSGDITMDQLNKRFVELDNGANGFAKTARTASGGIGTSFTNMKNAVVNGMTEILQTIDTALQNNGFKNGIATVFDGMKQSINDTFKNINSVLSKVLPPIITAFVQLGNILKPFTPILNGLGGGFTTLIAIVGGMFIFQQVAGAVKTLFAALTANPYVLAIAGIVALVLAIKNLWDTNKGFRDAVKGIWKAITDAVQTAVKSIKNAWNASVKWLSDTWNNIKNGAKGLWDGTIQGAKNAVDSVKNAWNGIKEWFANLWKGTTSGLASAWDSVTTTLAPFVETIKSIFQPILEFFSGLWGQVQTIFGSAWEIIKTVVMGPVLLLIDLITGDFNQFKEDFGMLWQTLATAIQTIVQTFVNIVVGFYSSFFQTVVNIWTTIVNTIQSLWGAFTTWVVNMAKSIVDGIVNGWNSLKQGTVDLWNATVQWVKDTWAAFKQWVIDSTNAIVNGVKQCWENLKQGTIDLWNGMINGLKGIWDGLKQSVSDLIDNVKTTFNSLKDVNLFDIGKAIIDGFVKGLKSAWEAGMKFIGGIGDWIREHKGPIRVDRKLLIPAGNAIMSGLNSGLTGGFREVQSNVSGMGDMIANAINSDYSVDIGANVAAANRSISSQVSHDVNINQGKQPALFNVRLGNQNFKAFVDDISNAQGQEINLNMGF